MQVGSPGGSKLTYTEQRSHFALWAVIKSPLIIGGRPQVLAIIARHQAAVMCALPMQSCFVPLCMHPAEQPWVKSRNMKKEELTLLKSREVIAINQDPLGIAGDRVWKQGPYEVILPASVPYAYRDSLSEIAQSSDQGMRLPV